jgi:type IV pilus assembly protein PilB
MAKRAQLIEITEKTNNTSKQEKEKTIDEILLESKIITFDQLQMAKDHLRFSDKNLTDIIVQLEIAEEVDILNAVKTVMNFDGEVSSSVVISNLDEVSEFALTNMPIDISEERKQVIYDVDLNDKKVYIATSDIISTRNLNNTKKFFENSGFSVVFCAITGMNLSITRSNVYRKTINYKNEIYSIVELRMEFGENLGKILSLIVEYAAMEGSSDIFFNLIKEKDFSYIYFKINQVKEFKFSLPTIDAEKLHQYVKQSSRMEAAKLSGHQDGSLKINILNKAYEMSIRTSVISTIEGEQIVLRLLSDGKNKLSDLGFEDDDVKLIEKIIKKVKGVVIIAGKTGSGKTTTLHSILNYFDRDKYNIITLEDPVEIRKTRINQIQINNDSGQGFAEGIRAILRQAPDIILIGEIRDKETAMRAVELALTGHLVLCTIHAPSINGINDRLTELDIGRIENFSKYVCLAVHQELVKTSIESTELILSYEISEDINNPMTNTKKVNSHEY